MAAEAIQPEGSEAISDGHHPHPLLLRARPRAFRCDRCKCDGFGRRYVCRECKLCFHELCATCPDSITFFMHPDHTLTLQRSRNPFARHTCEACGDPAHGYFFRCKPCSFELHPFCSLLRPTIADDAHPGHTLAYAKVEGGGAPCAVCGEGCAGWRYVCQECPAHVHMRCLSVVGAHAGDGADEGTAKKGGNKKMVKTALMVAGGVGVVLAVVLAALAGEEAPDLDFDFDLGGGEVEVDDFGFDFEVGEEAEAAVEEVAVVAEVEAELEAAAEVAVVAAEGEAEHEAAVAEAEANEAEAEKEDEDSSDSSDSSDEEEEEEGVEEEEENNEEKKKKKSHNPLKSFLKAMGKGDKEKKEKNDDKEKEKKKDKKKEDEKEKKKDKKKEDEKEKKKDKKKEDEKDK